VILKKVVSDLMRRICTQRSSGKRESGVVAKRMAVRAEDNDVFGRIGSVVGAAERFHVVSLRIALASGEQEPCAADLTAMVMQRFELTRQGRVSHDPRNDGLDSRRGRGDIRGHERRCNCDAGGFSDADQCVRVAKIVAEGPPIALFEQGAVWKRALKLMTARDRIERLGVVAPRIFLTGSRRP